MVMVLKVTIFHHNKLNSSTIAKLHVFAPNTPAILLPALLASVAWGIVVVVEVCDEVIVPDVIDEVPVDKAA
jgi:hypothetical protein